MPPVEADIKRWREDWFLWERSKGAYRQRSREWLRGQLARWITSQGVQMTVSSVSNTEEGLRSLTYLDEETRPPCWVNAEKERNKNGLYVSFKNGILNLDKPDEGLLPHSPDFWTLVSLPYDFDIEATCPQFEEALAMWQPSEEARLLMQAWAGYCFIPGNPEQVFLLNQGEGGDGKSQWATVLRALLGERNVQGVGLEAFDPKNRFGLEPLLGAVLNIVGDANDIEKMGEGVLKAIVGGDPITIDRKHKSAITEKLPCKFMMNCNQLPPFRDRTEGLWRRVLLLLWEQVIPQEKRIKDFGDVIVAKEVQGIFNWALCGYHRVRKSGFCVDPLGRIQRGLAEARSTIQKEREFLDDCVGWDPDPGTKVMLTLPALVGAYQSWCREHNNKANLYGQNLGKCLLSWLRETYPEHKTQFASSGAGSIKQRRPVVADDESTKRQWVYRGVYLRREAPELQV